MTDSQFPASNRTIKVIDDERELVAVVRTMLEEKGFNVTCAYIGLELFASLKEQKPDLILLDIMMPQMGGLEELTRFKEDPSIPFIPVILLTEKADDEDVMVGYKRGADFYITKPFTKDQLLDGVNSTLSRDQGDSVKCLYEDQYANVQDKVAIHQNIILGEN